MRNRVRPPTLRLYVLVALCTLLALPSLAIATQDVSPRGLVVGKAEDGTEFTIGMEERLTFFRLTNLDLSDKFNFRALTIADLTQGDATLGVLSATDVLFKLTRGPVSLFALFEIEASVDELVADVNHVNLEQVVMSYKLPYDLGVANAGFGVHIFDPEGNLIYGDEAPGIWIDGSKNNWQWNLSYFKRISGNRGVPFGRSGATFPGDRSFAFTRLDIDTDLVGARLGYDFKLGGANHLNVTPMLFFEARNTPQSPSSIFPCPIGAGPNTSAANCDQPLNPLIKDQSSRGNYFFPGLGVTGRFGPLLLTGEAVGRLGDLTGLPANTYGVSALNPNGVTSYNADSFAVFGELAIDLTEIAPPLSGITPFVSVQWNRGNEDPFGKNLGGFVSISDLNEIVRKDSFNLRSITSFGAMTLGGACEGSFGFNTTGRGIGPTLGTSSEDAQLSSQVFFNNRCGKGDNPGMIRLNVGWVGQILSQWDTHLVVSPMWFDETAPIKAEAAGSRISRGVDSLGCAGTVDCVRQTAKTIPVDNYMGTQVNFNFGFNPTTNFRIGPFMSVFIPGQGAKDIGKAFLDVNQTDTAWMGGLELRALF